MAIITTLFLDLLPDNIPFFVQTCKADGTAVNPTVDTLAIYEEDGADATEIVAANEITNSPFDPIQIPTDGGLTGWWGLMIAKSNFSAGKFYLLRWQMTVDSVVSAKTEIIFFCNASQFKATGFSTPANITTAHGTTDGKIDAIQTDVTAIDGKTTNLPTDPASETNVNANETKIDAVKVDTAAILVDTNETQTKLPSSTIASEANATTNKTEIIAEIDEGADLRTTQEG